MSTESNLTGSWISRSGERITSPAGDYRGKYVYV